MDNKPISVYNDNRACVCWSKSTTTKGLRHITLKENAVRESIDEGFINVQHIAGEVNIADIFTKEMKDTTRFIELRNLIVTQTAHIESQTRSPLVSVQVEGGIE
jgi:hypothetical protein